MAHGFEDWLVVPFGTPNKRINFNQWTGSREQPYGVGEVLWTNYFDRPDDRYTAIVLEPCLRFDYTAVWAPGAKLAVDPSGITTTGLRVVVAPNDLTTFYLPTPTANGVGLLYCCAGWFFPVAQQPKRDARYPHKCPTCGQPAYVGFSRIDCTGYGCRHRG